MRQSINQTFPDISYMEIYHVIVSVRVSGGISLGNLTLRLVNDQYPYTTLFQSFWLIKVGYFENSPFQEKLSDLLQTYTQLVFNCIYALVKQALARINRKTLMCNLTIDVNFTHSVLCYSSPCNLISSNDAFFPAIYMSYVL